MVFLMLGRIRVSPLARDHVTRGLPCRVLGVTMAQERSGLLPWKNTDEGIQDMAERSVYDAVVVGAGPNGLAAAVELARNGCSVAVVEAEGTIGGGARSAEITLPGFVHDLGSAIHPFGYASPFFRSLPLEDHGLEWIHPPASLAHPFDDGTAAMLERSTQATGATLGSDAEAYRKVMDPWSRTPGR